MEQKQPQAVGQNVTFDAAIVLRRNEGNRLTPELIAGLVDSLNANALALVEAAVQQGRMALQKELEDAGLLTQSANDSTVQDVIAK